MLEKNINLSNCTIMKKNFLLLLLSMFTLVACADSKSMPITFEQLPNEAQTFIQKHFPSVQIDYILMEDGWNTEYEVRLSNGTKVEFNEQGDMRQVDCEYGSVPESILLNPIKSYLQTHFPNTNVTEYHVERKEIKVELNTGIELVFNAQGGFLRIDD